MKTDSDDRLNSLFAAARGARPDTSAIEGHFETRLLARIRERREQGQAWFYWVLRLAPAFTVIAIVLGISNFAMNGTRYPDVFTAIAGDQAEYQMVSYLEDEP
jgi:hypothetical protein